MKKLFGILAIGCLLGSFTNAQQFGVDSAAYIGGGASINREIFLLEVGAQIGVVQREGPWAYGGMWYKCCALPAKAFCCGCDTLVPAADFYVAVFFGFAKIFWQETPGHQHMAFKTSHHL